MAHHLGPTLGPTVPGRVRSSFLIRDPARGVPSFLAKWPDVTDDELGHAAQHRLFDLVVSTTRSSVGTGSPDRATGLRS